MMHRLLSEILKGVLVALLELDSPLQILLIERLIDCTYSDILSFLTEIDFLSTYFR